MSFESLLVKVDVIFVMGVSGCGKTTVGRRLADTIGYSFKDGDEFHSEANVAKMKAGVPLTDEDRTPWLEAINTFCRAHSRLVVACSALKSAYRNVLRNGIKCRFVFLSVSKAVLQERLRARKDHFMPPELLDTQLVTLEDPSGEPDVITVRFEEEIDPSVLNGVVLKRLKSSV